ncbi:NAD(P)H-hydrate dehydratase [Bacteriovorax sp. DB6_IX]|uniref:NAD(P)H-hydrate dehydratase n=1 Tax=Bacteriovorax sp. DB6_IX TaxID=1353530 RepID=UPI00038A066F|nr:NAD(P)H-hydrate dehydratase [Bacteriovorax sp. DB6_IX]EQC51762.1 YjeF family C-terminal domain protein [Bacteriovorax sp. DB6_IX]
MIKNIDGEELYKSLKSRKTHSNKYDYGHLVCIGGNYTMAGAITMCALAAMRSGVGLVTLLTREESVISVLKECPEAMVKTIEGFDERQRAEIYQILQKARAIVIGPGLGRDAWSRELYNLVLDYLKENKPNCPLLLDADALYFLSQDHDSLKSLKHTIVTPHSGEASRLLGGSGSDIDEDREGAVKRLADLSSVALLKGAQTLIAKREIDYEIYQNDLSTAALATAGSGDVLSGIIASLIAQGHDCFEAARLGTWLHSQAALEYLKEGYGERSLIATDIISYLRKFL